MKYPNYTFCNDCHPGVYENVVTDLVPIKTTFSLEEEIENLEILFINQPMTPSLLKSLEDCVKELICEAKFEGWYIPPYKNLVVECSKSDPNMIEISFDWLLPIENNGE